MNFNIVKIYIISVLFGLISNLISKQYSCGNFSDSNICSAETQTLSPNMYYYTLRPCPSKSLACPWYNAKPNNTIVNCTVNPVIPEKTYPGQECNTTTSCYYGNCQNGTCSGKKENETCAGNDECFVGYSCYNVTNQNGICRKQSSNLSCLQDYDCPNNYGCLSNNTCMKYFTGKLNETFKYLPGDFSFCASGLADKTGKCISRKNLNSTFSPCNNTYPCVYLLENDNTTITDNTMCIASYGNQGNSYCSLGNGMSDYVAYVSQLNKNLNNSLISTYHTEERADLIQFTEDPNSQQLFEINKTIVKEQNLIIDSPSCVREVIYPQFKVKKSCPSVLCNNLTNGSCGNLIYFNSSTSMFYNKFSSNFSAQKCSDSYICNVSFDNLTNNTNNTFSCVQAPSVINNRYPGEKCDENNKCIRGKCNLICNGSAFGGSCNDHGDCNVGLFCNNSKCAYQVSKSGTCKSDYECLNSLGCDNGICNDWYSKNLSSEVNTTFTSNPEKLCKSGKLFNQTGKVYCVENLYGDNMNVDNSTGLVTCDVDDITPCRYNNSLTNETSREECHCALNTKGNSYCRKAYNEKDSSWIAYIEAMRYNISNSNCHTLSRFSCYDNTQYNKVKYYDAVLKSTKAHKFISSDTCIPQIFNSYPSFTSRNINCPKVSCQNMAVGSCGNYSIDPNSSSSYFYGQSCNNTSFCNVSFDTLSIKNSSDNVLCQTVSLNRYAGEKCDDKNKCKVGNCTKNICPGNGLLENCTGDENCNVGFYCKATKCLTQGGIGVGCNRDFDCQNNLGCYNGNCSKLYSVKDGNYIDPFFTKISDKLCESGYVSNNLCLKYTYGENMTIDNNSLVRCNPNDDRPCRYVDSRGNNFNEDCPCSLNNKGINYCRKAYDVGSWSNFITAYNKLISNKCHSLNRFSCFDNTVSNNIEFYNAKLQTINAHLFAVSDDCIKKIFNNYPSSSSEYFKITIAILITLIINLF